MKQLLFYATRDDSLRVLTNIEKCSPVKYVRMGQEKKAEPTYYASSDVIPGLGLATTESASTSAEYLVVMRKSFVEPRHVRLTGGSNFYLFDQLVNPQSISFSPGGLWNETVLLHGRVATVSDHTDSRSLFRMFASEFRRAFVKVKAYWVGSEALHLLRKGTRLALAAQSSRDFDLVE